MCLILHERSGPRSVSDFSTAELSASVQKKERKIYVKLTRRKLEHKLFLFGREKKEEEEKNPIVHQLSRNVLDSFETSGPADIYATKKH